MRNRRSNASINLKLFETRKYNKPEHLDHDTNFVSPIPLNNHWYHNGSLVLFVVDLVVTGIILGTEF